MAEEVEGLVVGEGPAVVYAAAVAAELGEGWTARDSRNQWPGSALLLGPEGEEVSVQLGDLASYCLARDRGRVAFVSLTPDGLGGYTHGRSPDITVSAAKPAVVVAKELERRMLARYRPWLAEARARKVDHDQREAERAEVVDQAAAILAALGYVDVWDRREGRHGKLSGGLSLGAYKSPVRVKLEVGIRYGFRSEDDYPTTAKAEVEVHRHLVPALARALASLATPSAPPERDGDGPAGVWVVHRPDVDVMEGFEDEWRAKEYAGFFEGATHRWLQVMSCSAAGQFFIDTVHGEDPDARPEPEWLCDECWTIAQGGTPLLLVAVCQDGCERDLSHDGACYPEETSRVACTRCGERGRLTRFEEGCTNQ